MKTQLAEVYSTPTTLMCRASDPEVKSILLVQDGNGLSGHYDRIHVFMENGDCYVYPAHNMHGWKEVTND